MSASYDAAALAHLLPEAILGTVSSITPIHMGLSGAGVFAVTSARGEHILRIQGPRADRSWTQQLLIWGRAAEQGIAPPIVHIDEGARAVVSKRVGVPLPAALLDPSQRGPAIAGVVARLRALHALDPSGIEERDPIAFARDAWDRQRVREGFPVWAGSVGITLDAIAVVLATDGRRIVGHNDINPGNILWDGARAWLVDWEVAGLAHPYYDLAALATFLDLPPDVAYGLLSLQEQMPLDDASRATFRALRQLVALVAGCVFLGLSSDITVISAPTVTDAPTLAACYAELRAGELDLQSSRGQAATGMALLRMGTLGWET